MSSGEVIGPGTDGSAAEEDQLSATVEDQREQLSLVGRLDHFQQRHRALGFPIAVLYKFFDDSGVQLSALIAYYGIVSLFPLLLLASSVLGAVLVNDPNAQQDVLRSALSQFPVIGDELRTSTTIGGGLTGYLVGILGAVYGGLGVAMAAQNMMNTAWAVPRNSRPNPFKRRGQALLLLATVGLGILVTTGLSALAGGGTHGGRRVLALAISVVVNAVVFTLAFQIATARPLRIRQVLPGAVAAAIGWQLVQSFGAVYINHVVRRASDVNAVFALVLGLIAFLYIAALVVTFCVEANVVRVEGLYPRALLTPITDNVTLTPADRRAYTRQAKAARAKGFQNIDVHFDE